MLGYKNLEMSLLFLFNFIFAILFLWNLSPIDVTSYFNSLGIFDFISRAYWSKRMYGHCAVDVFTPSINYWTDSEHCDHKQTQQWRETVLLEYIFIPRQVYGNSLWIRWAESSKNGSQDCFRKQQIALAQTKLTMNPNSETVEHRANKNLSN